MGEVNRQSSPALLKGVAGEWQLDVDATTIGLRANAVWGLVKVRGGFRAVEGGGSVGEDGSLHGGVVVDARSIATGNTKRDAHLQSDEFFAIERYPTFSFTADDKVQAHNGVVSMTGELSIREVARPITFAMRIVELSSSRLVVRADATVNRGQWGMNWSKVGASLTTKVQVIATFTRG